MADLLTSLIESGAIVDAILVVLVLETAAIALWRRRRSRDMSLTHLVAAALPGVFLLMSLKAALTADGALAIAGWLAASLPAHLLDLRMRPPR